MILFLIALDTLMGILNLQFMKRKSGRPVELSLIGWKNKSPVRLPIMPEVPMGTILQVKKDWKPQKNWVICDGRELPLSHPIFDIISDQYGKGRVPDFGESSGDSMFIMKV